ncbi:MAG TPA: cell division ATP-binding protein FtsE [Gemmatimonadales bacterium]
MIRFTNVSKEYPRGGTALRDVSLFVAKGEFVFFTGPSGAGKTTLLRHVYMEERPTAGEVRVGGYQSSDASRRDIAKLRRKLGIVFQDFRLLEDRTVEANVAFALQVIGAPKATIRPKVARALQQVGLGAMATSMPAELSGGERQRVAIARAVVNDPFVLIADEPTGNLDERASRGIYELISEINARGTAVLMATHDAALVRRAGHRVIELVGGQLVRDVPATALPIIAPTPAAGGEVVHGGEVV